MSSIKVGDKVFCFFDTEIPVVKGTVVKNESNSPSGYQKVHWDEGGVSYFPCERIFADYNKAKDYWLKQLTAEEKQQEQEEYETYIRLKSKYETV